MIGIMGMLLVNQAMFMHTHKLDNGVYVTHAHPYNKVDDPGLVKSHHHTKAEWVFLKNLEVLYLFIILVFVLLTFPDKAKHPLFTLSYYNPACVIPYNGRAPPLF